MWGMDHWSDWLVFGICVGSIVLGVLIAEVIRWSK